MGSLLVAFIGCQSVEYPVEIVVERTVLVYLAADNNLAAFALEDVEEMAQGMAGIDDTRNNLLVYIDTGSEPELFRFGKNREGKAVRKTIRRYPADQNSVDAEVMKGILSEAFTAYPAKTKALLLWSHAEGWLEAPSTRFFGQDGQRFMNISELKSVLRTAPHFDYIYFEACFMSGIEVLYELRQFADYFIGSPAETPGPGAPYDLILPDLFAGRNAAEAIAGTYFDHYKSLYKRGEDLRNDNWTAGAAIAVIRSEALEELASATRNVLPRYVPEGDIPRDGLMSYDTRNSQYHYDMDHLIRSLTQGNGDYLQWKSSYDKAVVAYHTTEMNYSQSGGMFSMAGSTGLSTYIPRSAQFSLLPYYRTFEWYQAGGWKDTGW
jgi:hypothetical protein